MAEAFADLGFTEANPAASFDDLGFTPIDNSRAAKRASLVAQQQALQAQPDPSLADLFFQETSKPFIDIPKPTVNPEDSALTKAGKGVVQSLAGAAETIESPLGVSTVALSAFPVVGPVIRTLAGIGFGAAGLLKGIQQMWSAAVNSDPAEAGRGAGNLLLGGAALGVTTKAIIPKEAGDIPSAPKTTEALKVADDTLVRLPGESPGVVSAPAPAPENITSLKNAVVDVKRVEQGLPEAEPVLRRSFGDAWDQAQEKIAKDPNYQNDLIDDLSRKPRAVTDTEDAALLQRQVELENASSTAQKEIIAAADNGDAAGVAEAKVRFNVLSDQLLDLYNVGKRAGTETARGLAARKMLADEQFNLTSMITQKRAANGGRRLTEPETEKITALKNDIDASQQALDEYQTEHFDRPPTKLDEDFLRLQAENVRLKTKFQQDIARDRLAGVGLKHFVLKSADFWSKWRRFQLLSGPRTLGKLTAAAALRMAVTPLKEAVGAGIGAVIPGISEGARIEGRFSIRGEANALTQFFTQGMLDAWQVMRTGSSDLDTVYGKLHELEPSVLDFFGHLHGALKSPLKRAAFARAFAKGIEFDMRNGVDVTDPLVQTRNAVLAYKEAQRAIFMEDNRLVEGFNAGLRVIERPSTKTGESTLAGKGVATAVRTELPIVRVPSNIVAQAFEHAFGLVTGSTRLALAYRKGFETLSEADKELILRQLKSGSVGGTLLLLGFFNPEFVGGYFQRGEKRPKADVKPDEARLFGVDIPSAAMHEPSLEVLQLGATVRRVADAKLRKKDSESQGITAGAMAGALGLIEESPFIRDMLDTQKAFDPQSRNAFFGELAKSIVVPQALSQIASQGVPFTGGVGGDVDAAGEPIKRQPQGILEHIESGIPILREDLAKKTDKKQRLHDPFKK